MDDGESTLSDGDVKQGALAWALRYAASMRVFPIDARNRPLVRWKEAATADPTTIEGWFAQAPHIGLGWAIPEGIVVVDLDEKNGKHGTRDFQRLDGRNAHDVATPQATTPSGGLHLIFAATRPYKNMAPAIVGTGVDTRALGGLIALPLPGNAVSGAASYWALRSCRHRRGSMSR
jgi:Bifunctional DNA primase/polymerase, N-terminal